MEKVIITSFTDPLCTWCWGEEPVFRKIETHYGDQVEFRFVMGGLVEDFGSAGWPWGRPGGGGIAEGQKIIGRHWAEASETHGMPTVGEGMNIFDETHRSSWPLNIAVKAAELADAEKAPLFLHRLREASTARGLMTTRDDVMLSIAAETGIDLQRFTEALRDGSAKKLFEADKNYAASLGITGFPTCIVEYGEKKVMLKGYNSYESFVTVINEISGGKVKPRKPAANGEAILELLAKYGRLAVEELRQAFDFPDQLALRAALDELLNQNKLRIEKAGNGYIVEFAPQGCANGICSI